MTSPVLIQLQKHTPMDHRSTKDRAPKAWLTDTGKVYRDKLLAEANTLNGYPEPLYTKPAYSEQELIEMADLWSPNDKVSRDKILSFARKLLGKI